MTAYNTGTITLAQGSKSVIGTDTGWQTAIIAAGVIYVQSEGGSALPFNTVVSDTEITAEIEWTGASGTYEYALVRETTYGTQQIATATALSQHVQRLANAAIAAIAGVTPAADKLLLFTGPSTATLVNRNDFIQGVDYDETVADLAGLALYDGEDEGFSVLVINAGDDRSAILIKKSATVADWFDPAFITPEQGIQGNPGGFTNITFEPVDTLAPGLDVTSVVTPTGPGAISIKLGIPAGVPGDIAGPSSSTVGGRPAFSDTTGKNLIEEPITALEAVFDNSVAGLKDNPATVQAAIDALATSPAGGANDALFALNIADLLGRTLGTVGGVADAFDDETGVLSKTNAAYDASNDWYRPTSTGGASQIPAMTSATTAGVTVSASNTNTGAGLQVWYAADKSASTAWVTNNSITAGWWQVDFGAGNGKTCNSYSILNRSGAFNQVPSAWVLEGSNDGTNFTALDTRSGETAWTDGVVRNFTISSPANYRYYRINVSAVQTGGIAIGIAEFELYSGGTANDMTLVSVAYPVAVQPASGRLGVQVQGAEVFAINVDLIAEMSRDNGVTWTAAVLALTTSLSGIRLFEDSEINLASQPAGTAMKWRVRTANNKNIQVSGVFAQGKD